MAPVTGSIADANQQQLVFSFCFFKSFLAPGMPVYRVVGMLKKIGAFFENQLVGEGVFRHVA